ncbi:MAG: UTP--glucose-1-phosphate uridylyltransferase [Flavobacteriaceae bacterium]|nr:UTP--glucose-1-phosphate uridylyltransferase [Flavobacteriaceae bacterium]|tara:strand:+ start:4308 stop:5174 length:867 start_codon:yes stop_codon:yes gene_type:complete
MAAGSGSRYGKLKQFDDLGPNGEFLMEFSIYDALRNGFNHIVVITKEENKKILKKYLSKRLKKNIKLDVLAQKVSDIPNEVFFDGKRNKPWGTAHAVWTARKFIKSTFVIINADDYYGQNAFKYASEFIKKNSVNNIFGLVSYQLKDTLSDYGSVSRGVCNVVGNQLKSIVELTKISKINGVIKDEESGKILDFNTTVSMNFWICTPKIFEYIRVYFSSFLSKVENLEKNEIYLPFVAQEMMEKGIISVEVINAASEWFGVTYYEDKKIALMTLKKLVETGKYPKPLW